MLRVSTSRLILFAVSALILLAGQPAWAGLSFSYTAFDPPMGFPSSIAYGISANGTIAGEYVGNEVDFTIHGYTLQNGVYTTLDYTGAGPGSQTWLGGINNAGDITGFYLDPLGNETDFIYHNGAFLSPAVPGSTATLYNNVNEAGLVASVYNDSNGVSHGAIYDVNTQGFTLLPDVPGSTGSYAQAVGPGGQVLVNYSDAGGVFHGSILNNGTYAVLDYPGAIETKTDSITSTGLIGGHYTDALGVEHGLVYDTNASQWYSVDYPGSLGTFLYYSNASDKFVGYYTDPGDGNVHSLLVSVQSVPEPGSITLLATGLGGLGVHLARRRLKST